MAITLGKDATLTLGFGLVVGVTDVQYSAEVRTIDIDRYGSRFVETYSTGVGETLTFTVNDNQWAGTIASYLKSGESFLVEGGQGGWSFFAVITSVSESDPLDGVVTLTVTCRRAAPP